MKPNDVLRLPSGDLLAACLERQGTGTRKPANSVLFRRGDPARGAYLVLSGIVELSLGADPAWRLINRTAGPGTVVGLPSAVSGEPYSLTATTLSTCDLRFVESENVVQLLRNDPEMALPLLQALAHEVHQLRDLWPKGKRGRRSRGARQVRSRAVEDLTRF